MIAPFCARTTGTRPVAAVRPQPSPRREAVPDHELDLAYVIGWQLPSGVHYRAAALGRVHLPRRRPITPSPDATSSRWTTIAEAGLITAAPLDSVEWSLLRPACCATAASTSVEPVLEIDGHPGAGARGASRTGRVRHVLPALRRRGRVRRRCCRCRSTARCPASRSGWSAAWMARRQRASRRSRTGCDGCRLSRARSGRTA